MEELGYRNWTDETLFGIDNKGWKDAQTVYVKTPDELKVSFIFDGAKPIVLEREVHLYHLCEELRNVKQSWPLKILPMPKILRTGPDMIKRPKNLRFVLENDVLKNFRRDVAKEVAAYCRYDHAMCIMHVGNPNFSTECYDDLLKMGYSEDMAKLATDHCCYNITQAIDMLCCFSSD